QPSDELAPGAPAGERPANLRQGLSAAAEHELVGRPGTEKREAVVVVLRRIFVSRPVAARFEPDELRKASRDVEEPAVEIVPDPDRVDGARARDERALEVARADELRNAVPVEIDEVVAVVAADSLAR